MKQTVISFLLLSFWVTQTAAQEKVFPGAIDGARFYRLLTVH